MKNIYEDKAMPEQPEIPKTFRQSSSPPTRPRKQVTPTPMQIEKERMANSLQAQMATPVYSAPYSYFVGVDQNGQPVYQTVSQPVYPQNIPGYPYAPYVPLQPGQPMQPMQPMQQMQPVQPNNVPEQPSASAEYNPGTRVLYQSPDFDMNDPKPKRSDVGANFAQHGGSPMKLSEDSISQEDIEVEEVSLKGDSSPKVTYKPRIIENENIEVDEVQFDSFNIFNQSDEQEKDEVNTTQKKKAQAKGKEEEKKPLPKSEIIRRVVLAVAIVAIIISGAMLINEWRLAKQNDDVEDEASNLIITEPTTDEDSQQEEELTPEQQWAQIKQEYPNIIFPANIQLKYAKLYAENTDFVGYLSADGVNLNLPVVQTDNDEEYLKKNFYGKTTKYGCPFVTHLNSIEPLDMNTVIFGHHMNNNTIFGTLDAYKTIDGFKKAPVITFNTLYKDYSWKVIAAFITNAYAKDDNGYLFQYYFTSLSTQERFSAYLNELAQRSLYDTGVDVLPTDKLLTLSTCSHEFTDARFVVVARLVRDGESTEVDTSKAVVNSSPRYPQAYYNAKKIKNNPYKNASQWQVG